MEPGPNRRSGDEKREGFNKWKMRVVEREKRWKDVAVWDLTLGNRIPTESWAVNERVRELKLAEDAGEGSLEEWENIVFQKHGPPESQSALENADQGDPAGQESTS